MSNINNMDNDKDKNRQNQNQNQPKQNQFQANTERKDPSRPGDANKPKADQSASKGNMYKEGSSPVGSRPEADSARWDKTEQSNRSNPSQNPRPGASSDR